MSTRALRRLRGGQQDPILGGLSAVTTTEGVSYSDEDEEEDDVVVPNKSKLRSSFLLPDDDDDENDDFHASGDESDSSGDKQGEISHESDDAGERGESETELARDFSGSGSQAPCSSTGDGKGEEDDNWDAILAEFQRENHLKGGQEGQGDGDASLDRTPQAFSLLLEGLDVRDLDLDHARNAALWDVPGGPPEPGRRRQRPNNHHPRRRGVGGRHRAAASGQGGQPSLKLGAIFGAPRPGWRQVPPTHVGGGVGMAPYDDTVAFDHYQQLQRRSRSAQSTTVSVSGAALSSSSSAQSATRAKTTTTPAIPWPYCDAGPSSLLANPKRWFGFLYSDVSEREVDDYSSVISRSNDLNNVLLTYVYHHPFCVPALLQVSSAMLEVAQQHRADNHYYATSFLRRALYVLETSALPSFSRRILACSAASSSSSSESGDAALSPGPLSLSPSIPPPPHPLMDYDRKEDRPWFDALQALVRIGTLTDLPRTGFAACRLLLSFDPLRDPAHALLRLDYLCLACQRKEADEWLVRFVRANTDSSSIGEASCGGGGGGGGCTDDDETSENRRGKSRQGENECPELMFRHIRIWYRDEQDSTTYSCSLLEMPNFAYSNALALFRIATAPHDGGTGTTTDAESAEEANRALRAAILAFPLVAVLLLDEVGGGRSISFEEWSSVRVFAEEYDRTIRYRSFIGSGAASSCGSSDLFIQEATQQAVDVLLRIYVQQNAKFWTDGAMAFLYDGLVSVQQQQSLAGSPVRPRPPSPALMRYSGVKARDYVDRIQQLPAEVGVVDFDWVEDVLEVELNRRVFFHGEDGRDIRRQFREFVAGGGGPGGNRRAHWLGGPPTNVVDLDWPLLEVFWRSLLPWNRVDGIPPPPQPRR